MRTILAGLEALKRTPLALLPIVIQSLCVAALMVLGAFPASGASAPASAVFPLDLFFDLKQSLAYAGSWLAFGAWLGASILVRGILLGTVLRVTDGGNASFRLAWTRGCRLAALGVAVMFPSAALFFIGVATRYAPFVWVAAIAGLVGAIFLTKRAVHLDVGGGAPSGSVPEARDILGYGMLIALLGAAMTLLGDSSPWLAAALVVLVAPLHALFILGWREHARAGTFAGGGALAFAVAVVAVLALGATTFYDRVIRNTSPVGRAENAGSLLLLGGVDSTSDTGSLAELDPRVIGFIEQRTVPVSYRGPDMNYDADDTRRDLGVVARAVSEQVSESEEPVVLLGHSQASLILDRMIASGLPSPERSVVLAPSPLFPPPVDIPPPDRDGEGRVGGDIARGFAVALRAVGLASYDIDAPASPTNLQPVVAMESGAPRMSVWALGDSVWLDRDWRRPGKLNLVALTDHVGVTNNQRALDLTRTFFGGGRIQTDAASWRGALVPFFRYAFEPWRPSR